MLSIDQLLNIRWIGLAADRDGEEERTVRQGRKGEEEKNRAVELTRLTCLPGII